MDRAGLVVGMVAKAMMPGDDPGGVVVTILLGIAGSLIGGFIGRALFSHGPSANGVERPGFFLSFVLAVVGSVILLAVYRMMTGRRRAAL
jgi:uncharacterized membrane protein YeaQ/YmgE (transglycosylase-associated protein family)